jgi:hypothetical protein
MSPLTKRIFTNFARSGATSIAVNDGLGKQGVIALLLCFFLLVALPCTASSQTSTKNVSVANLVVPDTVKSSHSESEASSTRGKTFKNTVVIDREIFQYTATGRRDPFVSLLKSDELRPLLSDLRLTTIAYDPSGRNSVAVLRDLETKQQYRMRVVRIDQRSVTFVIEEYGFSRQETLTMSDTSTTSTR